MTAVRLPDYLEHMRAAAADAITFTDGLTKEHFLADKRTQQAVTMSLVIIGEAATRIVDQHADFAERHQQVPRRNIRGMRNRIAHGYFEVDLEIVWDTVRQALPELLEQWTFGRGAKTWSTRTRG